MKKIIFCREGEAISDFKISEWVDKNIMNTNNSEHKISSHLIIDEVRVRVKEGKLNRKDLCILIQRLNLSSYTVFLIDKYGKSNDWVDSLDIQYNMLMKLM